MKIIEASELILNEDRSVYHLNLLPDDIAETIITVGDPDRVSDVSKHFDSIEIKKGKREFITHTGYIGKKRITVLSTGIGTDNIDIVMTELDALVNIDLKSRSIKPQLQSLNLIRLGTSGSLQKDISVDSIVASTECIGLDNLMLYYNLKNQNQELLDEFVNHTGTFDIGIQPYHVSGSESLIRKYASEYFKGITVTCSGFYGPQGRILRNETAIKNLPDLLTSFSFIEKRITNFEMETSGIYGMSSLMNHNALSLSVIVANRVEKKFSARAHEMIERLIVQTLEKFAQ